MKKLMMLLPDGYEEIEALTVVDFCRRAGMEVDMVSITGDIYTTGGHNIVIKADRKIEDINPDDYYGLSTPGGVPGTKMLKANERVIELFKKFFAEKKLIASICASPLVLEEAGIAKEIEGTIYPGFETEMNFKKFVEKPVVRYENVITSRGPCTAPLFAYEIIDYVKGKEAADEIRKATLSELVFK